MRHAATDTQPAPTLRASDLPPHVAALAAIFDRAWQTTAGPHWHEAGAMIAVHTPGPIRDGLHALPVLAAVRELHQPQRWSTHSDVVVCTCNAGAYPCPTAAVLDGRSAVAGTE